MPLRESLFSDPSGRDASAVALVAGLLASGRSVGGCMTLPPEAAGVPPHWMNYITVADCDGAARKAEGLGAKVVFGPMDVPSVGRFATLLDPQGAAVSIIKLG